jgi:hypothetical protein
MRLLLMAGRNRRFAREQIDAPRDPRGGAMPYRSSSNGAVVAADRQAMLGDRQSAARLRFVWQRVAVMGAMRRAAHLWQSDPACEA